VIPLVPNNLGLAFAGLCAIGICLAALITPPSNDRFEAWARAFSCVIAGTVLVIIISQLLAQ